ncbi:hypothetical protein CCICO_09815 [Corynebacterium ciconiae DSM 44920]|uniref:DUF3180 domain-containing protein n=1 Tax=Corynebacterium ciconiae TaxID=227319 RepID=UPI00036F5A3F|nr:DUF3180 domain-containing protein [Corynebacterium ciconiae]WKD61962.1 hypothetical protein CCICO_09815 [Corynebacterium ciconiae DSM 44920]
MKRTPVSWLLAAGGFSALVGVILTWGRYGSLVTVSATASVTLWVMALVCVIWGRRVRENLDHNNIGMDRSQLNPTTAALWLVVAKASAWTGAIVGGWYVGMATFVLPKASSLAAAQNDLPGVVISAAAGVALAAAGIYLERGCTLPPPPDGEPA